MNPLLDPLRILIQLLLSTTTTVVKIGSGAAQAVQLLLGREPEQDRWEPARESGSRVADAEPGGPAPGGTGRRPTSPRATPRRATARGDVELTTAPPEPTSAAGASGGIAGTMDAPGAAAAVEAPDPTAATSTRVTPEAPRRERRQRDVTAAPRPARRQTEPSRAEIDRRRAEAREAEATPDAGAEGDEDALVETEGAATPSATIRVDAPWDGYDKLKAPEIAARVRESDDATKAVVRLYEAMHKNRKSILAATEG